MTEPTADYGVHPRPVAPDLATAPSPAEPNRRQPRGSPGGEVAATPSDRIGLALAIVATVASIALWANQIDQIDLTEIDGKGLISAMPPGYFVAVALLALGFVGALSLRRSRGWLLAGQLLAAGVFLHGTVLIAEPLPRYPTTWFHAGITEYIARKGTIDSSFDARFSWPGFFSAAAMLTRAAGLDEPTALLRAAPLFFVLCGAIGVVVLARVTTDHPRVPYVAAWIFLTCDWLGQDYFAPQALAYVMALAFFAVLLTSFRQVPGQSRHSVRSRRMMERILAFAPDERSPGPWSAPEQRLALAVLLFLFGAIVMSHQLTPVVILAGTTGLVVTARTRARLLPIVLFTIFLAWLSFGAIGYWTGHLDQLFGEIGRLGISVKQNVGQRLTGDPDRLIVQRFRLGLTGLVMVLAAIGFLWRLRSRYGDLSVVVLAATPFLVLLGQSYGGEALLRSVFFSLPFLAVLAAFAFDPHVDPPGWLSRAVLWLVLVALVPVFVVARFGNEAWDMQTVAEHRAFEFVYDVAPAGSGLVSVVSEAPWGYRDLDRYEHLPREPRRILSTRAEALEVSSSVDQNVYIIVTRGQIAFGKLFGGLPADWAERLTASLLRTGLFDVAFRNADAIVLHRPPLATSVIPTRSAS